VSKQYTKEDIKRPPVVVYIPGRAGRYVQVVFKDGKIGQYGYDDDSLTDEELINTALEQEVWNAR
jgi:hypothetical protein